MKRANLLFMGILLAGLCGCDERDSSSYNEEVRPAVAQESVFTASRNAPTAALTADLEDHDEAQPQAAAGGKIDDQKLEKWAHDASMLFDNSGSLPSFTKGAVVVAAAYYPQESSLVKYPLRRSEVLSPWPCLRLRWDPCGPLLWMRANLQPRFQN